MFKNIAHLNSPAIPAFYIIDYVKNIYLLVSEGLGGYDARDFIENGLQQTLDIYHKDDFKIYNQKVFQNNITILQQTPQKQHKDLLFTYNFRIKCKNKKTATVLQKGFYVTDEESGLPKYSIGTITDITNVLKNENMISHIVEKNTCVNGKKLNEVLTKNYFFSGEENNLVTKQESIILFCLADGLSSKLIANKLKISVHTVNNHRQNMLIKTNTKNTAQLIVYAVKNKLI